MTAGSAPQRPGAGEQGSSGQGGPATAAGPRGNESPPGGHRAAGPLAPLLDHRIRADHACRRSGGRVFAEPPDRVGHASVVRVGKFEV